MVADAALNKIIYWLNTQLTTRRATREVMARRINSQ